MLINKYKNAREDDKIEIWGISCIHKWHYKHKMIADMIAFALYSNIIYIN